MKKDFTVDLEQKLDTQIDDSEMMTHILLNLPEEYQDIVEILEDKLDEDKNTLTINMICYKLSVKYN